MIDDHSVEYAKERYNEAVDRFKLLEDKALKIMTALSFALAVITATASQKTLIQFGSIYDNCFSFFVMLAIFCVFWAWLHALFALKVEETAVPNRSIEAIEYLIHAPAEHTRHYIINNYTNTLRELEKSTDEKAKNVEHSYNELLISGFLASTCFVLYILKELLK